MIFSKLSIENYKSFRFKSEISFPCPSEDRPIFLIGGMNGAGKTSLTEAINICLYGAKNDIIYKSINCKELAKGNAYVEFELFFDDDEGNEVMIHRSWNATAIDEPKSRDLREKLVVTKNGKKVSVQNKDLWQDYINSTIPKSITQFFFFDGEKIQEIAADDHSEFRLKSSLEDALGLRSISQLESDVLKIKNDERKNFIEISDVDIKFKESELKKEKKLAERKKKEIEELREELANLEQQYEKTKKRFMATFNVEPNSARELKQKQRRQVQLAARRAEIENQIKILTRKFLPWALAAKLFPIIRQQIEKEREDFQQQAIKENAEKLAKKIVEKLDLPYPIFDTPLSQKQKEILEQRLIKIILEEDSEEGVLKLLNLSDREAAKILNKMEEIEESDILQLQDLIIEKQEIENEIHNIENNLSVTVTSEMEKKLFEDLQQNMESYQMQIGRTKAKIQNKEEELLEINEKIKKIELEIERLYQKHNISREKAKFIEECDTIVNLLKEFKERLRKNKVQLLQEKTFEMYIMLSSKSGLIKDLEINPETYEIKTRDKNGHEMKKSGLSAGEKEVFAVSLLWGLAQTSKLTLPIIIDTPLSRLDSLHRDNIVNYYFPNAAHQVIILSTDTEVDNNYFKSLEPYLAGAIRLEFDLHNESTVVKSEYFWR